MLEQADALRDLTPHSDPAGFSDYITPDGSDGKPLTIHRTAIYEVVAMLEDRLGTAASDHGEQPAIAEGSQLYFELYLLAVSWHLVYIKV